MNSLIIMAANLGGLVGGNIYSKDDAPLYQRALRVMTGIGALNWVLVAVLGFSYYWRQRKRRGTAAAQTPMEMGRKDAKPE